MALGTFLDIEDVSFDAIERALNDKSPSTKVNGWIMKMIKSRYLKVELNKTTKSIKIKRGCPKGAFYHPSYGTW